MTTVPAFKYRGSVPAVRVKYRDRDCDVFRDRYRNGRTILELWDQQTGSLVCCVTVNLPDEPLAADEVIVTLRRTYDDTDQQAILPVLVAAGVVAAPVRWVGPANAAYPVCRLLLPLPAADTQHRLPPAKPPDWPEVWPVACVSTAAVGDAGLAALGAAADRDRRHLAHRAGEPFRVIAYPEGFWVHVPDDIDRSVFPLRAGFGPTFAALLRRAVQDGIAWLRFDADGPALPPDFLTPDPGVPPCPPSAG